MGADEVINFRIESIPKRNGTIKVDSKKVSGFAIKREAIMMKLE